jgi:diguanylate cyclase (GGDEF)-like protein
MSAKYLPSTAPAAPEASNAAPPFDSMMLEALPVAACFVAADGRIAAINALWQSLMAGNPLLHDFARREVRFLSVCKLTAAEGARALGARVQWVLRRASCAGARAVKPLSCEFTAGHQRLGARVTALPGTAPGCLVVCEDMTARHATERHLRILQAEERLQRHSAVQYAVLARFGQFVLEHPAEKQLIARLMETVREGIGATRCRLLLKGGGDGELTQAAGFGWESASAPDAGPSASVEVQITGRDGIWGTLGAWMPATGDAGADDAAFMQNLANIISAYLERKGAEDRLAYTAQFDALTGLPNRTLYLDRLAHAIDAAARDKGAVAVLFVDIDRFKSVNDTLGHAVGDELLVQIAARLKATVRSGDTIGRLSGDEFALVLSQLAQADHAALIGQKVNTALSTPFSIHGHTVYVSGSVGISLYPTDGTEPEVLLKNADMAMYRAKQSGRNACQFFFPQLQERALARLSLESRLREALDRDEYVLEYQPKVDLRSGQVSGLEALLRWRSPDGALVAPREFIPVLEDTGLIIPVGERVVSMVCAQLRAWQAAGCSPPPVAVNISARQFRHDELDVTLTRPIVQSGIDPRLFEFELTESMLMGNAEAAIRTLKLIKAQGIRLVLDDFGTGYSSLHYLKMFPLDALKIDREFIRDMLDDTNNARIVAAIVGLARNLDMGVIAEGVETPRQVAFLRRHGCTEAQGFGLSPPLGPAEVCRMMLEKRRWSFLGAPLPRRRPL